MEIKCALVVWGDLMNTIGTFVYICSNWLVLGYRNYNMFRTCFLGNIYWCWLNNDGWIMNSPGAWVQKASELSHVWGFFENRGSFWMISFGGSYLWGFPARHGITGGSPSEQWMVFVNGKIPSFVRWMKPGGTPSWLRKPLQWRWSESINGATGNPSQPVWQDKSQGFEHCSLDPTLFVGLDIIGCVAWGVQPSFIIWIWFYACKQFRPWKWCSEL